MTTTISGSTGVNLSGAGNQVTFPDSSVQKTAATGFGFKNRIINGACGIAQYGALSITGNSAPKIYGGCDRITGLTYGFTTVSGTLQQSGSGFGVLGLSQAIVGLTTTGSGGVAFGQRIESMNIKDCNGKTVTVQAKLWQNTGSAQPAYLRLNKANAVDNFSGVTILGTSSAFSIPSGVLTPVSATFSLGAADASNGILVEAFYAGLGTITSKDFHITDFQLELGSTATSFDVRDYGRELIMCQRYYEIGGFFNIGWTSSGGNFGSTIKFAVVKRTSPTLVQTNTSAFNLSTTPANTGSGNATESFCSYRTGGTGAACQYSETWTASAEL